MYRPAGRQTAAAQRPVGPLLIQKALKPFRRQLIDGQFSQGRKNVPLNQETVSGKGRFLHITGPFLEQLRKKLFDRQRTFIFRR